jgi:hypothetical protein
MPQKHIKKLDAKALMVIGSLCPISVEGVIRGFRWGIGPEGGKALSSHHIWTFILPARLFVGQNQGVFLRCSRAFGHSQMDPKRHTKAAK